MSVRRSPARDGLALRLTAIVALVSLLGASVPLARAVADAITLPSQTFAVAVSAPAGGTTLSGVIPLLATTAQVASSGTFTVSGSTTSTATSIPATIDTANPLTWHASWDTGTLTPGSYVLTFSGIRAADGVTATSARVTVNVAAATGGNAGTTTATPTTPPPPTTTTTTSGSDTVVPPTVTVIAPDSGTVLTGGVSLTASTSAAADSVNFVLAPVTTGSQIESAAILGADGRWHATMQSDQVPNGSYTIVARGIFGAILANSDAHSVIVSNTVTQLPVAVSVIMPSAGATLAGGAALSASTSVSASGLTFVVTTTGGTNVATIPGTASGTTGVTWTATWNTKTVPDGSYQITATAVSGSAQGQSTAMSVTVTNTAASVPLTVTMTSPSAGASFSPPSFFYAQTSGAADSLTFSVTQVSGGTYQTSIQATGGPTSWNAQWTATDAPSGSYTVMAKAVRNGTAFASAPLGFTVSATTAVTPPASPSVEVTAPVSGSTVSGNVALIARTSGAVEGLTFQVRNSQSGDVPPVASVSATGSPDVLTWTANLNTTALSDATYFLSAIATAGGTTVTSPQASFVVHNVGAVTPSETSAATVTIIMPSAGATVSGMSTFTATSSSAVDSLTFVLEGAGVPAGRLALPATGDAGKVSWTATWNTASVADGDVTLITVISQSGKSVESAPHTFTVKNAVAPPTTSANAVPGAPGVSVQSSAAGAAPQPTGVTVLPATVVQTSVMEQPQGTTPIPTSALSPSVVDATATLDATCVANRIPADRCDAWLASQAPPSACEAVGIITKEECVAYLKKTNGASLPGCTDTTSASCAEVIAKITAPLISASDLTALRASIVPLIGTTMTVLPAQPSGQAQTTTPTVPFTEAPPVMAAHMPIVSDSALTVSVHGSPAYAKVGTGTTHATVPAVLFIDSDGDGLPDDVERRIGTDPYNPDTDGDGFTDGEEVASGHNPLGPGLLAGHVTLAPIDVAIVSGTAIQQPRDAGTHSDAFTVDAAKNVAKGRGTTLSLAGHAQPNAVVTVFVYSDLPVVFTTTAQADGTWSYSLDNASLADGEHEAYVTVTDDTGTIVQKSNPLTFFVSAAKAVTKADFFNPPPQSPLAAAIVAEPARTALWWYLGGAALLVVLALVITFLLVMRPKKYAPPKQ